MNQALNFPGDSDGKASVYNEGDLGSIPGSGRFPGEGNGNPFQYSCLENPMDGGWCRDCPWDCKESGMTEQLHFLSLLPFEGRDFPGGSDGKESTCNEGDLSSIPGLGRSP